MFCDLFYLAIYHSEEKHILVKLKARKPFSDMAAQNVYRYYKFGFCKFSERCRFLHVDEECRNKECEVRSCTLRHPKICKYVRDYNICKFGEWCFFKHINIIENSVDKEEIAEKLEKLTKLINEKDILIKDLAEKIKVLEERVLKDNSKENNSTVNA